MFTILWTNVKQLLLISFIYFSWVRVTRRQKMKTLPFCLESSSYWLTWRMDGCHKRHRRATYKLQVLVNPKHILSAMLFLSFRCVLKQQQQGELRLSSSISRHLLKVSRFGRKLWRRQPSIFSNKPRGVSETILPNAASANSIMFSCMESSGGPFVLQVDSNSRYGFDFSHWLLDVECLAHGQPSGSFIRNGCPMALLCLEPHRVKSAWRDITFNITIHC